MNKKSNGNSGVIAERYVDIKAVSRYTSLPVKTLYEWSGQGKVPSIKIGRRILFDLVDIDRLMASLKRNNNQEENIVNKISGEIRDDNL
jgi:excisionase family DNA binding protein